VLVVRHWGRLLRGWRLCFGEFLLYTPLWGNEGRLANGCSGIVGFLSVVCVREYRAWKRSGGKNANANREADVEGGYKAEDTG